jgi:tetratricopeptide (TPR) repeat protein
MPMKKYFYFLFLFLLVLACIAQEPESKEIKFIYDAVSQARSAKKLLILEFWAPECGACIRLKHDIFENEKNKDFLSRNFLLVKVSPDDSVYNSLYKYFKLKYQCSVIILDDNGNEIDRTVSYDGNMDAYLQFLTDVSEGRNLYGVIFSTYEKDSLNANNNYLLAQKLLFRYRIKDAINKYKKVLLYDPENKLGHNDECKFRIAENEFILTGNLYGLNEYIKTTDLKNEYGAKAYEYVINDLINKKEKDNCISVCDEALKKYPDNYAILNKYAWAICSFKLDEDYEKALEMAKRSIALDPGRSGTYSTAAWIYYEMGDKEQAIQLQNKAIELYPHPSYIQDLKKFQTL